MGINEDLKSLLGKLDDLIGEQGEQELKQPEPTTPEDDGRTVNTKVIKFDDDPDATIMSFTFGTLMNRKLRKLLLRREVRFEIDEIEDVRAISVDTVGGINYHTVVSSEGDRVRGHIMYVTRDEQGVLDEWEDLYKRVQIKTQGGKDVWVYVLRASNIVDHGQRIRVELAPDEIDSLKAADELGKEALGK